MKKFKVALILSLISAMVIGCGKQASNEALEVIDEPIIIEEALETVSDPEPLPVMPTPEAVETPDLEQIAADHVDDSIVLGENHDQIQALSIQRDQVLAGSDSVDEINSAHEINKQITELNTYDFSGLKIACIGDSITYGRGASLNEYGNPISYVDYLRDILGCEVVNIGLPGSTIGNYGSDTCFLFRVDQIPEDTDIIIVFGGVNDYLCGNSVFGASDADDGLYQDAVDELFSRIRERCPDQEMFVVLTYQNALEYDPDNASTYPFDTWLDVMRCYSDQYDFHKIEMYRNGFMNSSIPEIQQTFFFDEVHPNDNGYLAISRYIAAKLVEYYN